MDFFCLLGEKLRAGWKENLKNLSKHALLLGTSVVKRVGKTFIEKVNYQCLQKALKLPKKVVGKGRHLTVNTLSILASSLSPTSTKFRLIIIMSHFLFQQLTLYSLLISIRQNYYFDMFSMIWHEIVCWLLKIYQDLQWFAEKCSKNCFCFDICKSNHMQELVKKVNPKYDIWLFVDLWGFTCFYQFLRVVLIKLLYLSYITLSRNTNVKTKTISVANHCNSS